MRIPAGAQGRIFRCVACGALIERDGTQAPATPAAPPSDDSGSALSAGDEQLLGLFIEMGLITKEQAALARTELHRDKEKIFETLLRLDIIDKDQMHSALSREPGTATINLAHFTIDARLTELMPVDMVLKHWALPIDRLGRSVTVAMVCPIDMEAVSAVEAYTSLRVRPMLCAMDDFLDSVNKHYRLSDQESDIMELGNPALLRREGVDVERASSAPASPGDSDRPVSKQSAPRQAPGEGAALSPAAYKHVAAARFKDLHETIARLDRLAIPARVLNQVDAVVGPESEGLRQVVCVVGGSPPFAADILATANSVAYGLSGSVDSIPMAVALIGEQAVAVLAANAPKVPAGSERQWFHLTRYSRHCAEIAAVLALDCGRIVSNVAYCAGLLHGIGSYALGAVAADEYRMIDPRLIGQARLHVEEQIFGLGHAEAGALLCESWNLPEILRESVRWCATPDKAGEYQDIAYILYIASCLSSSEGEVNSQRLPECQDAFKFLRIDPNLALDTLNKATIGVAGV